MPSLFEKAGFGPSNFRLNFRTEKKGNSDVPNSARYVTSGLSVVLFRRFQAAIRSEPAVFVCRSEALEKGRDSSARKMPMPNYSDKLDDVVAAVSIYPCGTLAFAYRSSDAKRHDSDRWDFMCARCGTDFLMPESELVFQSLPKEWLLSKVYTA